MYYILFEFGFHSKYCSILSTHMFVLLLCVRRLHIFKEETIFPFICHLFPKIPILNVQYAASHIVYKVVGFRGLLELGFCDKFSIVNSFRECLNYRTVVVKRYEKMYFTKKCFVAGTCGEPQLSPMKMTSNKIITV